MLRKSSFFIAACCVFVAGAQEANKTHFTARELFYSAAQAPPKAAAAAQPEKAPAPVAAPAPVKKAARVETASRTETKPPTRPAPSQPPAQSAPSAAELPGGAHIINASATSSMPLGLKYSILKKSGDDMVEVPASAVFHAGDRIQINVQTNQPGYLYIISQGSSGMWRPMFPSAEVAEGNNHIEGFQSYTMPPKSRILFDEQAGNEKLFLVFSREPEPSLEKMIYSLQRGTPAATPTKEEPVQPSRPKTMVVMADARIDDNMVGKLRTTYARDLLVEKVDESTPGERKETATYVVNPKGSPDSHVVADLQLVHK